MGQNQELGTSLRSPRPWVQGPECLDNALLISKAFNRNLDHKQSRQDLSQHLYGMPAL